MEFIALYLVLIGIMIDRYILPIFDLIMEVINYKLSTIASSESIKAQREQLKFQQEIDQQTQDDDSPRIGFQIPDKSEYDCDEDYDDEYDYNVYKKSKK